MPSRQGQNGASPRSSLITLQRRGPSPLRNPSDRMCCTSNPAECATGSGFKDAAGRNPSIATCTRTGVCWPNLLTSTSGTGWLNWCCKSGARGNCCHKNAVNSCCAACVSSFFLKYWAGPKSSRTIFLKHSKWCCTRSVFSTSSPSRARTDHGAGVPRDTSDGVSITQSLRKARGH